MNNMCRWYYFSQYFTLPREPMHWRMSRQTEYEHHIENEKDDEQSESFIIQADYRSREINQTKTFKNLPIYCQKKNHVNNKKLEALKWMINFAYYHQTENKGEHPSKKKKGGTSPKPSLSQQRSIKQIAYKTGKLCIVYYFLLLLNGMLLKESNDICNAFHRKRLCRSPLLLYIEMNK